MSLLQLVEPEKAEGAVKDIYSIFPEGRIPDPIRLFSASPGLLGVHAAFLGYYKNHPTLSFPLLTAIRYLAATHCGHVSCTNYNGKMLLAQGFTDQELEDVKMNPAQAPLEEKEQALLGLVDKVIKNPKTVSRQDIAAVQACGWTESDVLDAACHATLVLSSGILFDGFMKD